ncbi:MAG: HD domain-containing protein [Desulfurellales bacterium]|nr:MAG: HD domain-containing protein [Desulfurellales bacterium]
MMPTAFESSLRMKKVKFAAEIEEGQTFDDVFLVDMIQEKTKKNGGKYWALVLRDRTGTINAKLWDKPEYELPGPGEFVKVRCESSTYRDEVELKLALIRKLNPDTEAVEIDDFVPVGPRDRFVQMRELEQHVRSVCHDGLRAICRRVLSDPSLEVAFRDAPAAKTMHHAYVGGLIDHVLSICELVKSTLASYRRDGRWPDGDDEFQLSEDVLVAAAIWHDIGKTRELTWSTSVGYSSVGSLVGHVVIGLQMLDDTWSVFWDGIVDGLDNGAKDLKPSDKERHQQIWHHLQHIVASHHGKLEWGAAKLPMSREAQLFHLLDMIDSRMGAFDVLDKDKVSAEGFGQWSRATDGPFWRMPR